MTQIDHAGRPDADQDKDLAQAFLDLEHRRCEALLKSDIPTLEQLFSEDLVYTHASGRVDGKESYLAPRRSGSVKYHEFRHSDQKVRIYHSSVAVLTGRIVTSVSVDGASKVVDHRFTSVWVREHGAWKFCTYASSAVPSGS